MIISRTPLRVSFFGGGTDYPAWYAQERGSCLSMAIDKHTYISCRYLPPFFEFRSRIVYSNIELVIDHDQIKHPAVRESLKYMGIRHGVAIQHEADIPARTGVGSSSSFTVGLLRALYALKGQQPTKIQLARDAICVEQERIRENVGVQDQLAAAFGGFNRMDFYPDGTLHVEPVIATAERLAEFMSHLVLVFTGFQRNASEIAARQVEATPSKTRELLAMRDLVDEAQAILQGNGDLSAFGELLHEGWQLKRSLTTQVSTPVIDEIYEAARSAGALGGKLLGAGGGGFALFFVHPERRQRLLHRLRALTHVPFRMERNGSEIVVYQPEEPSEYAAIRETIARHPDRLLRLKPTDSSTTTTPPPADLAETQVISTVSGVVARNGSSDLEPTP